MCVCVCEEEYASWLVYDMRTRVRACGTPIAHLHTLPGESKVGQYDGFEVALGGQQH